MCVNGVLTYFGTDSALISMKSLSQRFAIIINVLNLFELNFATETHHELIYEKLFIFKCKVLVDLISNFNTLLALILTQFFFLCFFFLSCIYANKINNAVIKQMEEMKKRFCFSFFLRNHNTQRFSLK